MSKSMTVNGIDYILSFEDDFEGDRPDPTKWRLAPEGVRQDIGGQWRDCMTEVRNGELILSAKIDEDGTPISGAIRPRACLSRRLVILNAA